MTVRDVTGAIVKDTSLNRVLAHEHLVIDYGQMRGARRAVTAAEERQWVSLLVRLRNEGTDTLVDCTPPGYGRDLGLLARLAQRSEMTIVASTGSFCEQWCPLPEDVRRADVDELASRFMAELQLTSAPPAGVIKVASSHDSITVQEQKVMRAACAVHRNLSTPIVAHTTEGMALEQLDLFGAEGVTPEAVLISHVCAGQEPFGYALEIARRGAYVGFDRLGHDSHDAQHWVDLICLMIENDFADRVVLSHDSVQRFDGPDAIAGHTFSDPSYLDRVLTPLLERRGLGADILDLITRDNPARWLTGEDRT